eukprot:GHVU01175232.1.p1 GENE.GHVU01175232.1~~GHVU01175232.1.p1  ORF type:complete len:240 (-),score=12.59 GHVU01175232.1:1007-1726(-)
MLAELTPRNMKVFLRCIATLKFVAGEVVISANERGLKLTAVNECITSYILFTFPVAFFSKYQFDRQETGQVEGRTSVRLLLKVFHNVNQLKVEKLTIQNESYHEVFSFKFTGKYGIARLHSISYSDSRSASPKDIAWKRRHVVVFPPSLMMNALNQFVKGASRARSDIRISIDGLNNQLTVSEWASEGVRIYFGHLNPQPAKFLPSTPRPWRRRTDPCTCLSPPERFHFGSVEDMNVRL